MDITVTFRRTEPIETLKLYAEEKLSKLNKYFDFPIEAHVVMTVEKFRHIADVTLGLDGTRIKAVEETDDMYSAIDQVIDKIEAQVKKYRSKGRSRRAEGKKEEGTLTTVELEDTDTLGLDEPTIMVEKIDAKPMDAEEAAMQLNLYPLDFLVFRNSRSREINVIYKRKDGNLGLIEPSS